MTLLTEHRAGVLILTLSEPERRNPVTPEIAAAIREQLAAAEADSETRAVLLHGADGTFSSGGDLRAMPPTDSAAADARLRTYAALVTAMAWSPLPLVCAIEGTAAGIALGVATACDLIVSADDARFLLPFTRLGLFPDGGLLHGLTARVGAGRAKALLLLGDPVSATDAHDIGLVDRLTPPSAALETALELTMALAARAPLSVSGIKQAFAAGTPDLATAVETERDIQGALYFSSDFREGQRSFFDKRQPRFSGR
ncbi:MAG TPA: enoyl-CoA hydratase-related protein [Homoserinimonas sp.]|nr:enoyl-CoA hydratase-related protein [Homoserinimonas sp.]